MKSFEGAARDRTRALLGYVGVGVVALLALTYLFSTHAVPDLDYWTQLSALMGPGGFELSLARLFQRSNEHVVFVTNLLYVGNSVVLGGDNRGLTGLAWLFSLGAGLVLVRVLIRDLPGLAGVGLGALVVGVAVYNPMASHNFFMGMSGVAWLSANLFCVLALGAGLRFCESGAPKWAIAAVLSALVASQCYSTGVLALTALGAQVLYTPGRRRPGLAILVLGLALIALVAATQPLPSHHPDRTFDPLAIGRFFLTFLGGAFATEPWTALAVGLVGLVVFAGCAGYCLRHGGAGLAAAGFWVGLASFAVLNAGVGGVSRASFGLHVALSGRYAILPSLFWVAVIGIASCALSRAPSAGAGWRRLPLIPAAGAALMVVAVINGAPRFNGFAERVGGKPVAALALYLDAWDHARVHNTITSFYVRRLYDLRPALISAGHVPFNGLFARCPQIGDRLNVEVAPPGGEVQGFIDLVTPLKRGDFAFVQGWAAIPSTLSPVVRGSRGAMASCVAIVNQDGEVRGLAVGGGARPDVAGLLRTTEQGFGWEGYALAGPSDTVWEAVARPPGSEAWRPIHRTEVLARAAVDGGEDLEAETE